LNAFLIKMINMLMFYSQSAQRRIRSMVASGANPVPRPQQRNSRPTETPQQ